MSAEAERTPSGPAASATTEIVVEPESMTEAPRRRRLWPWIVGGALLVLVLVAALVSDGIARSLVQAAVEERVVEAFELDPDAELDVTLSRAPIIPQLLAGRLDSVDIAIPELPLGELTGAVRLRAESVPLDGDGGFGSLTGTFSVDEGELVAIAAQLSGIEPERIVLDDPEIVVSTTLDLFGFEIRVGLGLEPGMESGALVFTPTSFRLGDETLAAEQLTSNPAYAFVARQLLQQESICIAALLPAEVSVDDASVEGARLVLTMSADGAAFAGGGETGSCAG